MAAIAIVGAWRTTATPDALWTVVNDLGTWPAWWPAISRADVLDGSHETPDAARLTFDTPSALPALVVTLTIHERDPAGRLVVEVTDGPMRGHGTVTVADHADGATARYDVELRVRSLLFKPLEPILATATRSSGRARLARAGEDLARLAGGELLAHDA